MTHAINSRACLRGTLGLFVLSLTNLVTPLLAQSTTQTRYEIFPLRPNLHFQYLYDARSKWLWVTMVEEFLLDSGIVEYTVRDSTVLSDTTVAWNIAQREKLWHVRYAGSFRDTSYWTDKDTSITLIENRAGNHALTCSSWVWSFPLPRSPEPVCRYADTSQFSIVYSYSPRIHSSATDSLSFAIFLGLRGRVFSEYYLGNMTYFFQWLTVSLVLPPTCVLAQHRENAVLGLDQNFPNPFNPTTRIRYQLPKESMVELIVYDLLGREVKKLVDGPQAAGFREVSFDAKGLASGIYIYRLHARALEGGDQFLAAKKLVVLR